MPNIAQRATLDCRIFDVAKILTYRPADWMPPFFRIAAEEGDQVGAALRSALGGATPSRLAIREMQIEFEEARQVPPGAVELPFRCRAAGYSSLFTVLDGRLLFWATGARATELVIEGACDVPAEVADDVLGATAVLRAAERAAGSLLTKLKAALEERMRTQDHPAERP